MTKTTNKWKNHKSSADNMDYTCPIQTAVVRPIILYLILTIWAVMDVHQVFLPYLEEVLQEVHLDTHWEPGYNTLQQIHETMQFLISYSGSTLPKHEPQWSSFHFHEADNAIVHSSILQKGEPFTDNKILAHIMPFPITKNCAWQEFRVDLMDVMHN